MPGQRDLSIYQGDTFTLAFRLVKTGVDEDGSPTRTPWDLTGHVGKAQIRRSVTAADAFEFDVELTDPAEGEVELTMPAEITTGLSALSRGGVWDFETTDPDGVVRTWLAGNVTVTLEVTR